MAKWTAADIPDQSGRTFVVTGANSGLGAVAATELARAGANVIVACRDTKKGEQAAAAMPGQTEVRHLDLADLASIRAFAADLGEIAVLVNNAGVMATPKSRTKDGFELQIGTNHLGHFALTGLLLGRITDRVVTMSSAAHRMGRIHLDDLNWDRRRYQRWQAYGQSKLANLLFTYELDRRFSAAGSTGKALAAHPGYAATNLQSHTDSFQDRVMSVTNCLVAQSAHMGALPALYAATQPPLPGGSFIGPDGLFEQRGYPKTVRSSRRSYDETTAAGLWNLSETLTGVTVRF
ncbi:MAG: SDR family NAD(P)-dependent oxidoreductase [Acidimicrobiales bacterium]|nr:SDR family NAD(P)-dependent oxidoreductase [Acidimicrobiales bacterium]